MLRTTPSDEEKTRKGKNRMIENENNGLAVDTPAAMLESSVNDEQVKKQALSLVENTKLLQSIYKMAKVYANSTMIPAAYQRNPDNCFVAIELAGRMGVSPTLVMQNLAVVQGRPAWSGQSCIALVNGCGKFANDLNFNFVGEAGTDEWGCFCEAVRKADGRCLTGTTITIGLAKKEGWYNKNGSKWQTIPQQMLMYRAASWFARAYCPEVLMGFSTADEAEDIAPAAPQTKTISL